MTHLPKVDMEHVDEDRDCSLDSARGVLCAVLIDSDYDPDLENELWAVDHLLRTFAAADGDASPLAVEARIFALPAAITILDKMIRQSRGVVDMRIWSVLALVRTRHAIEIHDESERDRASAAPMPPDELAA